MQRIRFGRWEVEVDIEATAAAYARRERGAPEECGCQYCRNFAQARPLIYTEPVVRLLDSLGVRPIREAETWQNCELRPGVHLYGGFMHAVGRIVSGEDVDEPVGENATRPRPEPVTPGFRLGFGAEALLVPDGFPRSGLIRIEFDCEVPWVLAEPYEGPAEERPAPPEST